MLENCNKNINVRKNKFDKTTVDNLEMFESTSLCYWNSGFSSKKDRSGLILLLEDDHFHIMQPSFFLCHNLKNMSPLMLYDTTAAVLSDFWYFGHFSWFHDKALNLLIRKTVGRWLTQNTPAVATPVCFCAEISRDWGRRRHICTSCISTVLFS